MGVRQRADVTVHCPNTLAISRLAWPADTAAVAG